MPTSSDISKIRSILYEIMRQDTTAAPQDISLSQELEVAIPRFAGKVLVIQNQHFHNQRTINACTEILQLLDDVATEPEAIEVTPAPGLIEGPAGIPQRTSKYVIDIDEWVEKKLPLKDCVQHIERLLIRVAMHRCRSRRRDLPERLGLSSGATYAKLKKHNLNWNEEEE
jgi:DNA-binding NtrC family response regulator